MPARRGNDRGVHRSAGTDAFEIFRRCRREAGLDYVDAQEHELLGDSTFQCAAGRCPALLAVSQCRIEDLILRWDTNTSSVKNQSEDAPLLGKVGVCVG
jgi:hypothetical protein